MREGEGSAEAGGEGGREYSRITGRRRRDGSRPAGGDVVLQVGRHGGYAVARTGPDADAAGLAARAFRKPLSCSRAISIAWVMT
jgi:hypothetical protein